MSKSIHIEAAIKKYPTANQVAVWNFAGTAPLTGCAGLTVREVNEENLQLDVGLYGWNKATADAIRFALNGIYKEQEL